MLTWHRATDGKARPLLNPAQTERGRGAHEASSDARLLKAYFNSPQSEDGQRYLDELFSSYHRRMARWCYRFTGERETAADLAQESLLRAYLRLEYFRGRSSFSTWLYAITRNACLDFISKSRKEKSMEREMLTDLEDSSQMSPFAELELGRKRHLARELLDECLDETERRVFVLHFGQELPLDAINRLLGLQNASGARAYLVSAKRKLAHMCRRRGARAARTCQSQAVVRTTASGCPAQVVRSGITPVRDYHP